MSEGNGHPYSWSAIFNGYDRDAMAMCPFPAIPEYLGERSWPEDFLGAHGSVTHVWTQDRELSDRIARASRIEHVVQRPQEMLDSVDGVLLARDDAEHHLGFAAPFLQAGVPVYIDKPLALHLVDARQLLELEQWPGQLFTCSALRFAAELVPPRLALASLGELRAVEGTAPGTWERYAVHVVEPVVALLAREGLLGERAHHASAHGRHGARRVDAQLTSGVCLSFATTGGVPAPITIELRGSRSDRTLRFVDSFQSFRSALQAFVSGARDRRAVIPREETLAVVEILSWGM